MQQTTTVPGSSLKWGRLAGHVGPMIAPPGKIAGFIFSLPGCGKSNFMQSNPDAYIFNLDLSSTTTSDPQAAIWPVLSPTTGEVLDSTSTPMVLTQEKIQEKVDLLCEMATKNEPRPSTICFDSVTAWLSILTPWIVRNAIPLGLRSMDRGPATSWRELEGKAAWDLSYSTIVETMLKLRAHGYGVYLTGHIVKSKVAIGPDLFTQEFELTMGPGLWKRLIPHFEISALIDRVSETESYEEDQTQEIRGVKSTRKVRKTRPVERHYLHVKRSDLDGVMKSRVPLPPILLPEKGAWAAFASAYCKA